MDHLWAKTDSNGNWLPLSQHLKDTQGVMEKLWQEWLTPSQREWAKHEGVDLTLASFVARVHDLGKATPTFQLKNPDRSKYLETQGFEGLSTLTLSQCEKVPHNLAGQILLEHFGVDRSIAAIIGAHHGYSVASANDLPSLTAYFKHYYQGEGSLQQGWDQLQRSYLPKIDLTSLFKPSLKGAVFLEGLLIMADWISSCTDYFPLIGPNETAVKNPDDRLEKGFKAWKKPEPTIFQPEKMAFWNRFGKTPYPFQEQFIHSLKDQGLVILEAPMGLGKTEAALIGVEQLAHRFGKRGLLYTLPTQATSNALFDRVKDWLSHLGTTPHSLRLVHGKAAFNPSYQALKSNPHFEVNPWFTRHQTALLDDFVVATIDQLLQLALKSPHLALGHLGLTNKVVVIDEAHACDVYMNQYLERILEWLGAYQVPVIILSATLNHDHKERLFKAYLGQKTLTLPKRIGYPQMTWTNGKNIWQKALPDTRPPKEINVKFLEKAGVIPFSLHSERASSPFPRASGGDPPVETFLENVDEGIIGIVVNTVKKAQALGQYCLDHFPKEEVLVLHSAFILTDRLEKENHLLSLIGKNGQRPKRLIVIGTQVIEQSLDIDFDVLISDLAPIDLMLQRLGRLHRHSNPRPNRFSTPTLYWMENPASKWVYDPSLLDQTRKLLPQTITLPLDIPRLIDTLYDKGTLDKNFLNRQALLEQKAKINRLESPTFKTNPFEKPTLIGWNCPVSLETNSRVRMAAPSNEVILLKEDSKRTWELVKQTIRLPQSVDVGFLEAYTQSHFPDWKKIPWLNGKLGYVLPKTPEPEFPYTYSKDLGLKPIEDSPCKRGRSPIENIEMKT